VVPGAQGLASESEQLIQKKKNKKSRRKRCFTEIRRKRCFTEIRRENRKKELEPKIGDSESESRAVSPPNFSLLISMVLHTHFLHLALPSFLYLCPSACF
jgi:hypothetical protein